MFKSILSLDTQASTTTTTTNATSPAARSNSSNDSSHDTAHELRGAASQLFSVATSTISNKINELVNGSSLVLANSDNVIPIVNNNKTSPTASQNMKQTALSPSSGTGTGNGANCTAIVTTITGEKANIIHVATENNNGHSNGEIDQKNLVFPNETPTPIYIERRENSCDSISNHSKGGGAGDDLGKFDLVF